MRHELFASQGFAHAFIYPLALILADSRALCFTGMCLMVVLRLHLPEEELDGVLHEAGDGHRTYAARNWGND